MQQNAKRKFGYLAFILFSLLLKYHDFSIMPFGANHMALAFCWEIRETNLFDINGKCAVNAKWTHSHVLSLYSAKM